MKICQFLAFPNTDVIWTRMCSDGKNIVGVGDITDEGCVKPILPVPGFTAKVHTSHNARFEFQITCIMKIVFLIQHNLNYYF